jgi:sulfonate transport system ATP-binding protein
VEEAIALADRVILIEAGQIALDLPITLPRPRARGSAVFAELKERVLERVMSRENSGNNNKVVQLIR